MLPDIQVISALRINHEVKRRKGDRNERLYIAHAHDGDAGVT